jgi:hypothetical protein
MTWNRRLFAAGILLAACVMFAFAKPGTAQTEGQETQVLTLKTVTAADMAKVLKDLYGSEMKIAADDRSNSLIVIASRAQVEKIQAIIDKLEKAAPTNRSMPALGGPGGGFTGMMPLSRGGTGALAPGAGPGVGTAGQSGFGGFSGFAPGGMMAGGGSGMPMRSPGKDAELDKHAHELSLKYRVAPADQKAAIKKELRELTAKHFDFRQEERTRDIKELTDRLEKLRETVKHRTSLREEIINRRVNDLVDEDHDLRWSDSPTLPTVPARRTGTTSRSESKPK